MSRKQAAILIAALLLALSAVFLISVSGAEDLPTMFCNDEAWDGEERFGFERIFSQYYLPVSMFEAIDGVEAKENTRLGTLLISYGNRYISFDTDSNFAYTEQDGSFFLRTYLLKGGERYVQAESVCRALGLTFEVSEAHGAVRIRDNTTSQTIDQLIASYQTQTLPPQQTEDPTPTVPVLPSETKNVYLFFDGLPADPKAVLAALEEHGAKATFFLEAGDLKGNVTQLTELIASGHAVGLSTADGKPAASSEMLIASLHEQNEMLFRALKTKTRLFHMPYGANGRTVVNEATDRALASDGFLLCHSTIDVWDEHAAYTPAQITARVLSEMLEADRLVLRFGNGMHTQAVLEGILQYLSQNAQGYRLCAMDYSSYEPY